MYSKLKIPAWQLFEALSRDTKLTLSCFPQHFFITLYWRHLKSSLGVVIFYRVENTHKPQHFAQELVTERAAWSSVTCTNTAPETQRKESSASIHAGTSTQSTWKRLSAPQTHQVREITEFKLNRMASFRDFSGVYYITLHKNKPVVFTSACFKRGMCNALRNEAGAGMGLWTGLFND